MVRTKRILEDLLKDNSENIFGEWENGMAVVFGVVFIGYFALQRLTHSIWSIVLLYVVFHHLLQIPTAMAVLFAGIGAMVVGISAYPGLLQFGPSDSTYTTESFMGGSSEMAPPSTSTPPTSMPPSLDAMKNIPSLMPHVSPVTTEEMMKMHEMTMMKEPFSSDVPSLHHTPHQSNRAYGVVQEEIDTPYSSKRTRSVVSEELDLHSHQLKENFTSGDKDDEKSILSALNPSIDVGATIKKSMNMLTPNQISSMTKDTRDLIETQKSLLQTVKDLAPVVTQGREMLETFKGYFGDSKELFSLLKNDPSVSPA